jgi:hypothetical protein
VRRLHAESTAALLGRSTDTKNKYTPPKLGRRLLVFDSPAGFEPGVVLGNPRLEELRGRGAVSLKADADKFARNVAPIIRMLLCTTAN